MLEGFGVLGFRVLRFRVWSLGSRVEFCNFPCRGLDEKIIFFDAFSKALEGQPRT